MNIGIIGSGTVGGNLGVAWAWQGHQILFATRDSESDKIKNLLSESGTNGRAGSAREALTFGEVIVVAVPWNALEEAIKDAGDWTGKIVIDATNRFTPPPADSTGSAGEDLARLLPGARVVKAFNTIGAERFLDPQIGNDAASMLVAGDDAAAKSTVMKLAEEIGFDPVDAGPLSNAGLLESMARLWVYLSRSGQGRDLGFKLLRR